MNPKLSNRINAMATSATLAMAAKARELRQEGKDIINNSPFDVIAADDLDDAAEKIVKAVKG